MNLKQPRILFVFTEDWAFLSLFLDRAVAAKDAEKAVLAELAVNA